MKIPFVDLETQYNSIKQEIILAIDNVLESRAFIKGKYVSKLEEQFLEVHGGKFAIGCSSGTSALTLALRSLGIGQGDAVITCSNTFFATIEAICEVGARPVLVDINPETYGIDITKIENAIDEKTKAIIPVHLYGNPCEMDTICRIAHEYNLKIIEDCAQAHLATYDLRAVGTFGDASAFSFYPGKNLGAYGDAGLVLVSDSEIEKKVRMLSDHGRIDKYMHQFVAGNHRMDGIQAAILSVKLKYLKEWTKKRISVAAKYDEILGREGFSTIKKINNKCKAVYHLYVVQAANRQEVIDHLSSRGISTGIHYPIPLHLQPALTFLNYRKGTFPNVEYVASRIISLPIYPELSDMQIEYITREFLSVAKR